MAERKSQIKQSEFRKGYYIELNCSMCMTETSFGADTKTELSAQLKESGWKNLCSDLYGSEGWWCGCDYKD
jgi:hypothetical protein